MDQYRGQACCCCCPFQQRNRRGNHCGQTFASDTSRNQCPICKDRHFDNQGKIIPHLAACPEFQGMSTDKQKEMAIRLKHCLVCLRPKNYKDHTNPCSRKRYYCSSCPDPACKTHRSKYCRNRHNDYSAAPAGNKCGKCGENDRKGKNSGAKKNTQPD